MATEQEIAPHRQTCAGCSFPLPVRAARPGEIAALWECSACGQRLRGVIELECPTELRRHVRRVRRC